LAMGVVQMGVENLLSKCGRTIFVTLSNNGKVLGHLLVVYEVVGLRIALRDFLVQGRTVDGCKRSSTQQSNYSSLGDTEVLS
jgi:hypothetical protein